MQRSTLSVLACPCCREAYEAIDQVGSDEQIEQGFLRCSCRTTVIPIVAGFAMFAESLLHESQAHPEALAQMAHRLFGTAQEYDDYVRDKQARNVIESYAAFQPFNESGRAVEPLLPHVRPVLRADGFILDAWCRTGWSGEWLAGQFPSQRVVSLWEGDSSVLGYRGFRHLLGSGRRAANLDIVFCHPQQPLPFRSEAFDLLHAHDALHRFAGYPFANECLRIVRADGALLFPHVHLANSEPEPFFERGGTKLHGREYRAWLDDITAGSSRRGFVFSETVLFDGPRTAELRDDCLTPHYNGLIAILPAARPVSAPPLTDCRFIVNPMFRLSMTRSAAKPSSGLYDGAVEHYLVRHPAYQARLPQAPVALDEISLLALHLAAGGADRSQLLAAADEPRMSVVLDRLSAAELLLPVRVGAAAHYLQRVHANQNAAESEAMRTRCLSALNGSDAVIVTLSDGTPLNGKDIAGFARRLRGYLANLRIAENDWIVVCPAAHPLLWLAAIAAADAGIHVEIADRMASSRSVNLRLCADGERVPQGWTALGLNGDSGTLLSALNELSDAGDGAGAGPGLIEMAAAPGRIRCPLGLTAAGCAALRSHREPQLLLLGGSSPLRDFLTVLTALVDRQPLHSV